jgi:hypothetical protein
LRKLLPGGIRPAGGVMLSLAPTPAPPVRPATRQANRGAEISDSSVVRGRGSPGRHRGAKSCNGISSSRTAPLWTVRHWIVWIGSRTPLGQEKARRFGRAKSWFHRTHILARTRSSSAFMLLSGRHGTGNTIRGRESRKAGSWRSAPLYKYWSHIRLIGSLRINYACGISLALDRRMRLA